MYPNHCWQVDPSMCVLFYLPKGGLSVMEESKFYKNKLQNFRKTERERVWRYVITDHYSGTIYVRYVQAAGESAQGLVDVFLDAITPRGLNDPMHGVPELLVMDKGSANTAHLFTNLLDRLGVKWDTHKAGNPRAKGQVECGNNIVETKFESRLTFLRVQTVKELQVEANKWCQHFNAHAIHTRTQRTRNDVWLTITEDQLRLAPSLELCRELVTTRPVEVLVKPDMSITHTVKGFGSKTYDLRHIPGLVPRLKVGVVVNPYRAPAVDVIVHSQGEDLIWTVEPVKMDDAGFWKSAPVFGQEYKAQPDTLADKHVAAIDEAAG
ncbi:DDE-type integrase/transposase/recombinase, partial [Pseudodesulfovibrio sp. JC047]|nr:DDE-type integrase/transposase/recombinase [Pseudodesulfovibrio sp. JC047]